jgi:LacI family transcriptional regulator
MVGLLCGSLESLWQQSLAVGIGRTLLAHDRYARIVDAADDPAREVLLAQQLRDQRVDGLIVQPLDPSAAFWPELTESLPVVSIGDPLEGARVAGEVLFDNKLGVSMALGHLHALGHRRVTVLTPTRPTTPDRSAEVHIAAEAARLRLEVSVVTSPHALPDATEVARQVLSRPQRSTALFALADSIAYGAYAAARDLSLEIPGDVSVAGYDAHPMSRLLSPPMTSFDWDIDGIIRQSVRLVMAAIDGKPPRRRRIIQSPSLYEGASTGPPPR